MRYNLIGSLYSLLYSSMFYRASSLTSYRLGPYLSRYRAWYICKKSQVYLLSTSG